MSPEIGKIPWISSVFVNRVSGVCIVSCPGFVRTEEPELSTITDKSSPGLRTHQVVDSSIDRRA
jgi:hypothetical protein